MAISARDELAHILSTLTDLECERALELLAPLTKQEINPPAPLSEYTESELHIMARESSMVEGRIAALEELRRRERGGV